MKMKTGHEGPPGYPLIGNAPDLVRDRLGAMTRWAREYGDVVPIRLPGKPWFLVNHPDPIAEVLVHQRHCFVRPAVLRASRLTFGGSMFVSSGESWKRKRQLARPAFHRQAIARYAQTMTDYTQRMLATWNDGDQRDLYDDFAELTLAIVTKTLFGADLAQDLATVAGASNAIEDNFTGRLGSGLPIPDTWPTPSNLRLRRTLRQFDQVIYRLVADGSGGPEAPLISLLSQASENGDRLSVKEIRDECVAFLFAGHETTALALTWTCFLLAQHPEVEARLQDELTARLSGRLPTVDDVRHLPYTEAVLHEAMRVYPPAYAFARECITPCRIGDVDIPKGGTVVISQWVLHRDPRYWDRPDTFDPDRWADESVQALPHFVYFPFGGGPHLCIGAGFAKLEATLVLATVVQQFRLRLPNHHVKPRPQITLRADGGMPMTPHRRLTTQPPHPATTDVVYTGRQTDGDEG